jgi:phosphate transport system protein
MLRVDLDRQLNQIQQEIVSLGSIVDKATRLAVESLGSRDLGQSQQVVDGDDYIDAKRYEIEEQCINLIATQQPMARDLRHIIAFQHIASELERVGDYAEGIAKISLRIGEAPLLKPLVDIPLMSDKATLMLRTSIDALASRDVVKAYQVFLDDDAVDNLYDRIYGDLLTYMANDPRAIQRATYLLWVSHDLERIADRSTNIAKRVIYLVTGKMGKKSDLAFSRMGQYPTDGGLK